LLPVSSKDVSNGLGNHAFHLFVVRSAQRDCLQQYLSGVGIQTMIHYPIPPHNQKAYSEVFSGHFATTEIIHSEVLSLPVSSVMSDSDVAAVISACNSYRV